MPAQKLKKPAAKPAAKPVSKPAAKPAKPAATKAPAKPAAKPVAKAAPKAAAKAAQSATKVKPVPATKSPAKAEKAPAKPANTKPAAAVAAPAAEVVKKKPGRPPKNPAAHAESSAPAKTATGAKRGRKPKNAAPGGSEDEDLSDVEAEFAEEPVAEVTEKVKPLRIKVSKAKERALMKEFGLDETVLSEEEMLKRRQRLKTLIKLGKTRGYLTHAEITDHLPEKLVDAETLEVVVTMLNDMGVAVYEQTPDAETLLLTNTGPTAATEEAAEEEAEAA
ncbi:MAG: RNA polymerase sigma factor region1.1 domain-containing protein, partial [Burkholderiaceae bacterium]